MRRRRGSPNIVPPPLSALGGVAGWDRYSDPLEAAAEAADAASREAAKADHDPVLELGGHRAQRARHEARVAHRKRDGEGRVDAKRLTRDEQCEHPPQRWHRCPWAQPAPTSITIRYWTPARRLLARARPLARAQCPDETIVSRLVAGGATEAAATAVVADHALVLHHERQAGQADLAQQLWSAATGQGRRVSPQQVSLARELAYQVLGWSREGVDAELRKRIAEQQRGAATRRGVRSA